MRVQPPRSHKHTAFGALCQGTSYQRDRAVEQTQSSWCALNGVVWPRQNTCSVQKKARLVGTRQQRGMDPLLPPWKVDPCLLLACTDSCDHRRVPLQRSAGGRDPGDMACGRLVFAGGTLARKMTSPTSDALLRAWRSRQADAPRVVPVERVNTAGARPPVDGVNTCGQRNKVHHCC